MLRIRIKRKETDASEPKGSEDIEAEYMQFPFDIYFLNRN